MLAAGNKGIEKIMALSKASVWARDQVSAPRAWTNECYRGRMQSFRDAMTWGEGSATEHEHHMGAGYEDTCSRPCSAQKSGSFS